MSDGITLDFGSALPYLEEKVKALWGQDSASLALRQTVKNIVQTSEQLSGFVQVVGMPQPIPIAKIYQRTLLKNSTFNPPGSSVQDLLSSRRSAVIFAGPGFGKTTLLHWVYRQLRSDTSFLPMLFTLRWEGSVEWLEEIVFALQGGKAVVKKGKTRLVLLVDGYDEVGEDTRRRVSRALIDYAAQDVGQFYLTCREFYNIVDLKVLQCRLAQFSRLDAIRFVRAFGEMFDSTIDEVSLVTELDRRGFADFVSHPLLLALVCILRTSSNPSIPTNAIGLLRRAIDTLSFRWDASKSLRRASSIPLDGEERMRCLMRIAYHMKSISSPANTVESAVREHLQQIHMQQISPTRLLEELAQWYGILVPSDNDTYSFVHRTIHDFLAARFIVEAGLQSRSEKEAWGIRSAYVACLGMDATRDMERMLKESDNVQAFAECLSNRCSFESLRIAQATSERFSRNDDCIYEETEGGVSASTGDDFFKSASNEFLELLVEVGSNGWGKGCNTLALYSLSELRARDQRMSEAKCHRRLRGLYEIDKHMRVNVTRQGEFLSFRLSEVLSA